MNKWFVLIVVVLLNFSCTPTYYARYDIGLKEVERPSDAKQPYGEAKIVQFEEKGKTKFRFEDDVLQIIWLPTSSGFGFFLENKTSHSLKIIWDEAVYVDESGMSKRVIHGGVKYNDRNSLQPPTTIVRGAKISDIVFPTDNIYYKRGEYGGWRERPLFPNESMQEQDLESNAKNIVEKDVQILLPIKIKDVVNEYIFVFTIEAYNISTVRPGGSFAGNNEKMKSQTKCFQRYKKNFGIFKAAFTNARIKKEWCEKNN